MSLIGKIHARLGAMTVGQRFLLGMAVGVLAYGIVTSLWEIIVYGP